jgi:hypothetical protein
VVLTTDGTNPKFQDFVICIYRWNTVDKRWNLEFSQSESVSKCKNPHVILPSHHQQWFCINILTGMCGDNLFGPHVLPSRLTGWNYRAFLEDKMPDFLANVPLIILRELHLMYDGAPTHFSLVVHRYPNQKFPGQWLGRS